MNVESSTTVSTSKCDSSTSTSSSSTASTAKDGKTFKDELEETKTVSSSNTSNDVKTQDEDAKLTESSQTQGTKNSQENAAKEASNEKLLDEKEDSLKEQDNKGIMNSLTELNSKIATINDLKQNGKISATSSTKSKSSDKLDSTYSSTIKMDNQDITFFLGLVNNQQMTAQVAQTTGQTSNQVAFTDVKSEATQSSAKVSQALINALSDSANTNKPLRIDFDSDISVIMKVDKQGVISANFIPGSAAVENYLRNNIQGLIQTFNDQNLPYNELSYNQRQKGGQQEHQQQQNNNRENDNE